MASYVKYVEAQGARVVPLILSDPAEKTLDKLKHLNGVLFPGGGGSYYDIGRTVFTEIIKMNDDGQFFPAMGICLGLEYILSYTSKRSFDDVIGWYNAVDVSLPIDFTVDPAKTKLFGKMGADAYELTKHNYTYNFHKRGISPKDLQGDSDMNDFWTVTSTSKVPNNGTVFVATAEAKDYPIMLTQFHPEKPSTLFVDRKHINHEWGSLRVQAHLANRFVEMARSNTNSFGNFTETDKFAISNYKMVHSKVYGEIYVFE